MASLPYDWLLLAAVLSASLAGWRAFIASAIITADWLLFDAAWWDNSPAALIARLGVNMSYLDVWACTDFLSGVAVLSIAYWQKWAWALWALFTAMIGMHVCHELGMAFLPYKVVLDTLFLAQLIVLFNEGGRHIGNLLLDLTAVFRRVLHFPDRSSRQGG